MVGYLVLFWARPIFRGELLVSGSVILRFCFVTHSCHNTLMPPRTHGPVGFKAWYSLESEGQTRFIRSNAGAVREAWKLFEGNGIFNQEKPKVFEILKGFELEHHWDNFSKRKKLELEVCKKETLVLNEFLMSKTEDVAFVGMIVEGRKEDDHPPWVNSPS